MISQHWFRQWLGAVRQQAITWANVDPDLCRQMASLGHNELTMSCERFWLLCSAFNLLNSSVILKYWKLIKDRAHLSTFKIFIFEKCSCFIVLVVFLVIVQSSELISVWFCEKMTFFPNFFSYHIFAIYVGGASLGLPTACRLIAVSGARLVWS